MSPEQAAGDSTVDARGDLYSLGAVAFFALTARPPFQGKTIGQLLAAHRGEPPPPVTDLRPDVPAELAAIIARCLAKDPADRFQSAAELDKTFAPVFVCHHIKLTPGRCGDQAEERVQPE